MAMSLLASTMSMFDSSPSKKGQSRYIALSTLMPSVGRFFSHALTAAPKPYHPGSINLHWAQLNTHGIARRSSILVEDVRDAGRLPMLSLAISPITVDCQK